MKKSSWFNVTRVLYAAPIATLSTAVLLSTAPVNAAIVSDLHNASFGNGFNAPLPFFDSSLGSLTRVTMGFDFEVALTLSFADNNNSFPNTVSLSPSILKATATHPNTGSTVLTLPEHGLSESYTIPAYQSGGCHFFGCFPGSPGTLATRTNTYSFVGGLDSRQVIIDPIGLPPFIDPNFPGFLVNTFIGSGNFYVGAEGFLDPPRHPFAGIGGLSLSVGEATGDISVTYTYDAYEVVTPVPIPFALPMFLSGLIGLGLVGRLQNRANRKIGDAL